MRTVRMTCSCCRLEVKGRRQVGRCRVTVYEYNGVEYVGLRALGAAVRLSEDTTKERVAAENCLLISTAELRRQKRKGVVTLGTSSSHLAAQFCQVMARTMGAA